VAGLPWRLGLAAMVVMAAISLRTLRAPFG